MSTCLRIHMNKMDEKSNIGSFCQFFVDPIFLFLTKNGEEVNKHKLYIYSMADEFQLLPFLGIENSTNDSHSTIPLTTRDRQLNDRGAGQAYSNYQYNSHVAREMKSNDRAENGTMKTRGILATGVREAPDPDLGKAPRTHFWFGGGGGLESRTHNEQKTMNHMTLHHTLQGGATQRGGDYHINTSTMGGTYGGSTRSLMGSSVDVTRAGSDAWGTHTAERLGQGLTMVPTDNYSFKGTMTNGVLSGPATGLGPVGTVSDNRPHQILRLRQPPPSPQEVAARRQSQHQFPVPESIIMASTGAVSAVTESPSFDGNPRWYASPTSDPRQVPFKRVPYAEHYVPIVANDGSLKELGVHKDKNGYERGRGGVDQQWQQDRLEAHNLGAQVDDINKLHKKEQQLKYREVLEEQMRIKQFQARQERYLDNQIGLNATAPIRVVDRSNGGSFGGMRDEGVDGFKTRQFDANKRGTVAGGTSTLVSYGPKNEYLTTIDHVQRNGKFSRPPWVSDATLNSRS